MANELVFELESLESRRMLAGDLPSSEPPTEAQGEQPTIEVAPTRPLRRTKFLALGPRLSDRPIPSERIPNPPNFRLPNPNPQNFRLPPNWQKMLKRPPKPNPGNAGNPWAPARTPHQGGIVFPNLYEIEIEIENLELPPSEIEILPPGPIADPNGGIG